MFSELIYRWFKLYYKNFIFNRENDRLSNYVKLVIKEMRSEWKTDHQNVIPIHWMINVFKYLLLNEHFAMNEIEHCFSWGVVKQ